MIERVVPLVVRLERDEPPQRTDALEAAALAVLTLLWDPGEWAEEVRGWESGRIRKVVRRARGAEWRRAEALPGITVEARTAQVRIYPPIPLDGWPADLKRLQVSGTELADDRVHDPPAGRVLWLNPHMEISAGKAMAQAGHGAQIGWWTLSADERAKWAADGFPLAVRTAAPAMWRRLLDSGLPTVRDAGFTEIEPGLRTVVADLHE